MARTGIAVIGAGLIGRKHIEVVRAQARLGAVVDPSPAAQAMATDAGARWYPSVGDYLASGAVADGAIVATPNQLHLEHGAALLGAGIPVLMEKPLAENSADAARLVAAADASGTPLLVGHHRRHSPLVKAAKAAIEGGDLGRIVVANAQFWLKKPDDYFDVAWRRQAGAGPVFINLIHDIDLLSHFCGEIIAVQAVESSAMRGFEVEDSCAIIVEFAGGALGTVTLSDTVPAPWSWELTAGENPAYPKTEMNCYTIGGTKASLSVPDLKLWHHPHAQSWWAPIKARDLPQTPLDPVAEQCAHFIDVVEGRAAPLVSGAQGLKNLLVLDAIKQAARDGIRVEVGGSVPA